MATAGRIALEILPELGVAQPSLIDVTVLLRRLTDSEHLENKGVRSYYCSSVTFAL